MLFDNQLMRMVLLSIMSFPENDLLKIIRIPFMAKIFMTLRNFIPTVLSKIVRVEPHLSLRTPIYLLRTLNFRTKKI